METQPNFDPHHPDMSFVGFDLHESDRVAVNPKNLYVGWLGADEPYRTGDVPEATIEKLAGLLTRRFDESLPASERNSPNFVTAVLRGPPNACPLCDEYPITLTSRSGQEVTMGAFELMLPAADLEEEFVAPSLVHHYIAVHGYRPPQNFLDAIDRLDLTRRYDCNRPLHNDYHLVPRGKRSELTAREVVRHEPYDENVHW